MMAGLACGEVSLLAWEILRDGMHDAVIVDDDAAIAMMRRLAQPKGSDLPVVAGESATCGLAAASMIANDAALRDRFEITPRSRVMVFGTEADTDPDLYFELVGKTGDDVRRWRAP